MKAPLNLCVFSRKERIAIVLVTSILTMMIILTYAFSTINGTGFLGASGSIIGIVIVYLLVAGFMAYMRKIRNQIPNSNTDV